MGNHCVKNFYDGQTAFDNISNDFDLYILDVNTPNINGLEVLKNIKNINQKTKVIIISVNININLIKEAYNLGCDDYIKKPFDIEELIFKINRYENKNNIIYIDTNITFNIHTREFFVDNILIDLTKNEKIYYFY